MGQRVTRIWSGINRRPRAATGLTDRFKPMVPVTIIRKKRNGAETRKEGEAK